MIGFGTDPNELPEIPEYEFGTNTGRQGIFNPKDRNQHSMALQRLEELQTSYGDKLDPNFTGNTELTKNDSLGFSNMLNAQTEAMNIQRILGGQRPMNIEDGGIIAGPQPAAVRSLKASNPNETYEQRMARYGRG